MVRPLGGPGSRMDVQQPSRVVENWDAIRKLGTLSGGQLSIDRNIGGEDVQVKFQADYLSFREDQLGALARHGIQKDDLVKIEGRYLLLYGGEEHWEGEDGSVSTPRTIYKLEEHPNFLRALNEETERADAANLQALQDIIHHGAAAGGARISGLDRFADAPPLIRAGTEALERVGKLNPAQCSYLIESATGEHETDATRIGNVNLGDGSSAPIIAASVIEALFAGSALAPAAKEAADIIALRAEVPMVRATVSGELRREEHGGYVIDIESGGERYVMDVSQRIGKNIEEIASMLGTDIFVPVEFLARHGR